MYYDKKVFLNLAIFTQIKHGLSLQVFLAYFFILNSWNKKVALSVLVKFRIMFHWDFKLVLKTLQIDNVNFKNTIFQENHVLW